jgi:DNA polymerase iota
MNYPQETIPMASSSCDDDSQDIDDRDASSVGSDNGTTRIRCILHADVDSFYSQVETLERNLDPSRPLAIGQKHIIVTCNYAAREVGITKLMSREQAQIKCPHMLIVEGSDLERYRRHARKIYECFRKQCQHFISKCAIRKLHMDEMVADLSGIDDRMLGTGSCCTPKDIFVYDLRSSKQIVLTEDQTGAQCVAPNSKTYTRHQRQKENATMTAKLFAVASVAMQIRQTIHEETGFTVTMGVSNNPLLAKLASGLQKPGKVNILPPGPNSRAIVESMPLRKIPGLGSRTMKLLRPCLAAHFDHGKGGGGGTVDIRPSSHTWTCR